MTTITVEEIVSQPQAFIDQIGLGDDIVITRGSEAVARVSGLKRTAKDELYGSLSGKIWIGDNFDEPLEEFYESA
jgi:antitoxin (DNA-binding transcriptional repressor) of toxin-antitoxin stability system